MGKTIIITEKPSVAMEYVKVLNIQRTGQTDGYVEGYSSVLNTETQITWAIGHLIGIDIDTMFPKQKWSINNLPKLPGEFKYKPLPGTIKQFNTVKKLYLQKDVDAIYYAGDSGREGIYIQALIRDAVFKTPPKCKEFVVWIDSYTNESILNGIKNAKPYSAYEPMIASGYERAKRDCLFGVNYTEAITVLSAGHDVRNTGRVMTPTLAMVVDRQNEIDNFSSKTSYTIKADEAECVHEPFVTEAEAKNFIKTKLGNQYMVTDVTKKHTAEQPPYLFNLTDLQGYCTKQFSYKPSKTLEIAQKLYEKKLITYPRTDARVLSTAVAKELEQNLCRTVADRYVNDAWITDHYAIIPTSPEEIPDGLGLEEESIYNAILMRFQNIFEPAYEYDTYTVLYDNNGITFKENIHKVLVSGWKQEPVKQVMIPKTNDVFTRTARVCTVVTKPPAAYTTGSLITAMEKAGKLVEDESLKGFVKSSGIGTSATRAGIIDKLETVGYITVDRKQKITPTLKGIETIKNTRRLAPDIASVECTARLESELNEIAEGKTDVKTAHKQFEDTLKITIENIRKKSQPMFRFNL